MKMSDVMFLFDTDAMRVLDLIELAGPQRILYGRFRDALVEETKHGIKARDAIIEKIAGKGGSVDPTDPRFADEWNPVADMEAKVEVVPFLSDADMLAAKMTLAQDRAIRRCGIVVVVPAAAEASK